MRTVQVSKVLDAPQQNVWDVLYDFPNISQWNSGVTASYATGQELGVGAQRHCDLSPTGQLEETLLELDEPNRALVRIDSTKRIPIKHGEVEFQLEPTDLGTTVTLTYSYAPKGGPLSGLVGRVMDPQLQKGFGGFLDDLGVEAAKRAGTA
ncbi:MAG: SRPBCC family protein [Acidimicrobiales bacterium]